MTNNTDKRDESGTASSDDEYVQVNVRVPKDAKERADAKLPHGGLTREVRERIREIASGRESEVDDALSELMALRDERRELAAEIDQLDVEIERQERALVQLIKQRLN